MDYAVFKTGGKQYRVSPVVIIDLDEASLKEVGQWPWPRNQLAQMTLNLFKMGVRVVGFDVIFAEPDRMNSQSVVTSLSGLDEETKNKIDERNRQICKIKCDNFF